MELQISPFSPYASPRPVKTLVCALANPSDPASIVCVAGGEDCMIRLWVVDPATQKFKLEKTLQGHVREVTSLLYNGGAVWSTSVDATVRIWDLGEGDCKHVVTSSDGTGAGGGGGGGQGGGQGSQQQQGQGHSQAVTCSTGVTLNNEFYALTGSLDATVKAWDSSANLQITEGHGQGVYALETVVDAGGNTLLIVGE